MPTTDDEKTDGRPDATSSEGRSDKPVTVISTLTIKGDEKTMDAFCAMLKHARVDDEPAWGDSDSGDNGEKIRVIEFFTDSDFSVEQISGFWSEAQQQSLIRDFQDQIKSLRITDYRALGESLGSKLFSNYRSPLRCSVTYESEGPTSVRIVDLKPLA